MPTQEFDIQEDRDQYDRRRCRHIFTAGNRCGSPCLRRQNFCYFHHTTRKPVALPKNDLGVVGVNDLPNPEDRDAVRAAVTRIMHAIANDTIDIRRAGMLLYSLQITLNTFPPQPRPAPAKTTNSIPKKDLVEDVVLDDTHGVLACDEEFDEEEYEPEPRRSLARQLLDEVERYEAQQAAEATEEKLKQSAYDEGRAAGFKAAEEVYGSVVDKEIQAKYERERNTPAHWRAAEQLFIDSDPNNRKDDSLPGLDASAGPAPDAPPLDSEMWVPLSPELSHRLANHLRYRRFPLICLQSASSTLPSTPAPQEVSGNHRRDAASDTGRMQPSSCCAELRRSRRARSAASRPARSG